MPELPEVEVVCRGVAPHVVGRTFDEVQFHGERVTRRHQAGGDDLRVRLEGAEIRAVRRRGKYLWWVLGDDDPPAALVVHLGMSGQLRVDGPDEPPQRHTRAVFRFTDEAIVGTRVAFVDQRTFGGVSLHALSPESACEHLPEGVPTAVAHIAPDPFEPGFDTEALAHRLASRAMPLKRALLDQRLVSGIGNIYADESLWRAEVHGDRPCREVGAGSIGRVLTCARDVMRDALSQGGTSFDTLYVHVNGASGYFDRSLDAYGREGRPCRRCGASMRRAPFAGRSSYFCPRCQRPPHEVGALRRGR